MIAYLNGSFVDKEDVRISPDDRGFLFADGLYEVIRSYNGKLFRAKEHLDRLQYGAKYLSFTTGSFDYLADVAEELLKSNELLQGDATVYLQVTRGSAKRTHAFPSSETPLTIYATASAFDGTKVAQFQQDGAKAIIVPDQRWARCDLKTVGLTANVLANEQAHRAGAFEAIMERDGVLLEGTHSNFMAVFDDVVVTAPASNYILNGITRMAIIEICEKLDIKVEIRPVFSKDLAMASETMVVGTTVEVTPITQMDDMKIADGIPGPIAKQLQKELSCLTC